MTVESPWFKSYPPGMAHEIVYDDESLTDIIKAACEKYKNKRAFYCMGTHLTYQELYDHALNFAAFCQYELKLKTGDRIALMMPNILQYPVALFGALLAGLTVVNLNPLDRADGLKIELMDSEAKAIVVVENFVGELAKIVTETKLEKVIVTSIGSMHPWWRRLTINFVVRHIKKLVPHLTLPSVIRFRAALKLGAKHYYLPVALTGDDVAFLQYTGGTTGVPKGVKLLHRNMVCNLKQAATWTAPVLREGEEVAITALPLYHIFSLLANCLHFMYLGGENVLIPDPRNIPEFVSVLRKVPYTAITGVNTLFNALLHNTLFRESDFKRLKLVLGGGMAIQKAVADEWQKVTGVAICQAYGLSETSPAVSINPVTNAIFNGSVGLPIASTEVSIRNPQTGAILPAGEVGEICIRGPQVMPEYWHNPAETKLAFTEDGFFRSGDMGYLNWEGYLFIVHRLKDMIIVSGFNVYPIEVENIIKSMPAVNEVAVIGVPDVLHGELVKAYIIREKGTVITEKMVMDFCHEKLAAYKCPRMVEFVDSLPKSPVGKVLKKDLRQQELTRIKHDH